MSATMDEIEAYAAAVRGHLADLPPEEVDELTGGLAADLYDATADERHSGHGRSLLEQFGDPRAYADELRASAGLTAGAVAARVRRRDRLRRAAGRLPAPAVRLTRRIAAWVVSQTWWPPVRAFLVAVRPVWWVARGVLIYQIVGALHLWPGPRRATVLPVDMTTLVLLVGLIVVSVQWGRGQWLPSRGRSWVFATVQVLAIIAIPGALSQVSHLAELDRNGPRVVHDIAYVDGDGSSDPMFVPTDGVWVDGIQVSNLFVYAADGTQVDGAQIVDDRGRPVRTVTDGSAQEWWFSGGTEPWHFFGSELENGKLAWNVYPLRGAPVSDFVDDPSLGVAALAEGLRPASPPWPFAKATALSAAAMGDQATDHRVPAGPGSVSSGGPTESTAPPGEGTDPADPSASAAPDASASPMQPEPTATP